MRNKLGYLTIVLMLMSGVMGGCPTDVDNTLDPNDTAATDNSGKTSGDNTDDSNTDNGNTDNGNTDTGNTDTGNTDTGNTDTGNTDTGNTDTGNTDNGNTADVILTGSFAGTVAYTKTEAISGGDLQLPRTWNESFAFDIDADGIPVEYTIPGYMQTEGGIKFVASIHQVGDSVTLTETRGEYTATLQATVVLTNYGADGGSVTLQLVHNGAKGNLTEVGTGICLIEFTADGNNVAFTSTTDYAVKLNGVVNTQWHVVCDGTLTPQ